MAESPQHQRSALAEEALRWLIRLHSGNATEADRQRYRAWRSRSPAHERAAAEAEGLWQDLGVAIEAGGFQAVADGPGAPETDGGPRLARLRGLGRRRVVLPAALAALLLLGALLHYFHFTDPLFSDYWTAPGEQQTVRLDDGSTVLLNTQTAISLASDHRVRRVRLHHGQALFTVAKDRQRPFEVETAQATIRALGTAFEVYQDEAGELRITVQEQTVQIAFHPGDYTPRSPATEPIRLPAGRQLRYHPSTGIGAPAAAPLRETSAWQRRKLIFNDRPLAQVVAELNRYRRGHIVITDASLNDLRVTGLFALDAPDGVLATVQGSLGLGATYLTPWLVLLHR